jgi:N-acetylmuramoyl-L-alanine amidase
VTGRSVATALLLVAALAAPAAAQKKIVIDPGHGGQDPGGVGTGMQEKNVVLDTCQRFKALLDADTGDAAGGGSWTVFLTRSDDTFVELSARASYANSKGADRFMSIHSNAFGDTSANGTETFSYTGTGEGAALRNLVQDEMIKAWGLTNRGNKTADFAVLRETSMPAELHELAFITNATDAQKLASPDERQKAAEAHLKAIQRHYDIPPYIPGGGGGGGATGSIAGTVVDDLGPVEGATVAVDSGQSVVTPGDGSFELTGVPTGTRGLTVSAPGHEETVVQVEVSDGDQSDTEIHLDRSREGGGGGGGDAGIGEGPSADGDDIQAGCGCRAGSPGAGTGGFWLLALALVAWRARRRRREAHGVIPRDLDSRFRGDRSRGA